MYAPGIAPAPGLAGMQPGGVMTTQGSPVGTDGISAQPSLAPQASTDWGQIAGAGIGAAGGAVGGIAQALAQKQVLDNALAQSEAGRALSEKLARLKLSQNQDQFDKSSAMQALLWQLNAERARIGTGMSARDLRGTDQKMLSDVLARIYLSPAKKRRR